MKLAAAQVKRKIPFTAVLLIWICCGGCFTKISVTTEVSFFQESDYRNSPFSMIYNKYSIAARITEGMHTEEKIRFHRKMKRCIKMYFKSYNLFSYLGWSDPDRCRFYFDIETFFRNRRAILDAATVSHDSGSKGTRSWKTYILTSSDILGYWKRHPWTKTPLPIEEGEIAPEVKPVTINLLKIEANLPRSDDPALFMCTVYYSIEGPADVNYLTGEDWFPLMNYEIPEDVLEREIRR